MNRLQELENIYSIFHDGTIEQATFDNQKVELRIEATYLAEVINRRYSDFYLTLKGIQVIEFRPWNETGYIFTNPQEIFELKLSIVSVQIDSEQQLNIHCNSSIDRDFEGGILILKCSDYELEDQNLQPIELKKLKEISKFYWNELFAKI